MDPAGANYFIVMSAKFNLHGNVKNGSLNSVDLLYLGKRKHNNIRGPESLS